MGDSTHLVKLTDRIRNLGEFSTRRFGKVGLLLVGMLSIGLVSCTKYEIADHSYQFNEAIGSLGNRILLLNASRAAKNYPMQFSRISSYTGGGRVSGSMGVDVPYPYRTFGTPTGVVNTTFKPSVSLGTGVSQLQIADLDTAEAQQALKTPIKGTDLSYYIVQSWTPRIVLTTALESIQVTKTVFDKLETNHTEWCKNDPGSQFCWINRTKNKDCVLKDKFQEIQQWHENNLVVVRNNPRSRCQFVQFQWFLEAMQTSGFLINTKPPKRFPVKKPDKKEEKKYEHKKVAFSNIIKVDVNLKEEGKKPTAKTNDGPELDYKTPFVKDFMLQNITKVPERRKGDDGTEEDVAYLLNPIEFETRSPERMVRFIGDMIAAQSLQQPAYVPMVRIGTTEQVPLFVVKTGGGSKPNSTVSILDPERNRVSIPIPKYSYKKRHRSMEVLSLVMDVMNSAVSGKAIPAPNTIVLTGN